MDISKVKISVRTASASQRVVYGSDGNIIVGDEEATHKLGGPDATLTIAIKGQKGESLKAVVDGDGNVSGDKEAIAEALEGFPNERITSLAGVLTHPHGERLPYEPPAVISSVPAPLPGVAPIEDGAGEGAGAVPEGDSDRDSGDDGDGA